MKKTVNKILSVLLSAALLLTLLPAFAAAGPRDITEVFSAELFSDAAVNEFLKVFPQFAGGIESTLYSTPSDSPAYVELDPNGFSFSGDLYVKINGDCDTATFAEFFHAYDVNIYPQTLGAYLEDNGYGEIAAALLAAGEWADFDTGDGPAFDFDWGLDGIDNLAQRYEAFIGVIGTLIGAAKPMFALALGTQDLTLNFPGEMQFFKIVSPSIHMQYGTGFTAINKDLTDVVFYDITGSAVFPALGMYQAFVLPLYGALGVGTAIDYTFAAWNNTAEADALAALLFDPLYALVSAVQNDPAARETLISFYGEGCEERVAQIGAGCTQKDGEISVSDAEVDFQVTGGLNYVQSAVKEALLSLFCEFGNSSFSIDASAFADVEGYRDRLNALLPALTDPAACEHIPGPSVMEIVTEPTCCDIGWIDDVIYCELCGEELQRTRLALDRLPHSFYTVPEVPATCTSEGTSEYTVCEYCAVYGVAPEVIPALGHDWGEWETVIPATAETEGLEQRVCRRNASHIETRAIPMLPETPPVVASGVCGLDGDNLVWTLTADGVLTVTGEGRMCNTGFPRQDLKQDIVSAVLQEGVESVGARFFENCSALTSVSLPESLLAINMRAFKNCSSLSEIELPEGVHYLGEDAFMGCSSLTEITVPWVTSITIGAFRNCSALTTVTITLPYTIVGEDTFSGCSALTDIYYNGDAEDWYLSGALRNYFNAEIHYTESYAHGACGESARWRLTEDGEFSLIGYGPMNEYAPGAFPWEAYRGMIRSVSIADGITNLPAGALQNCPALTEVRIPASVAVIPANAFDNSTALATVFYGGGETLWEAAFNGVPEYLCNVQYFFSEYYAEGECGENITWTLTEDGSFAFHGEGHMRNYTNPYSWAYSVPWERLKSRITSVTMENGIYNLCEYAFFECGNLTEVVLSNTLDRLHSSSLRCCSGLTQLELPDSITVISSLALSRDTGLTRLRLPKNLTVLGHSSLYGCNGITKIELPKGLSLVRHEAFNTFTSLTDVFYTGSEAQWNAIEFEYGNEDLLNANIRFSSHLEPDAPGIVASGYCGGVGDGTNVSWMLTSDGTLTISGTGPMNANEYQWPMPWAAYKDSILAVQIGEGVETISASAFLTCSALTSVSIPEGMTRIGACAFYYCENLAELVLPESLTQIDNYAFCGCSSLTDVTLPAGLTRIETGSFTSCTGLSNVVIPEGVTYIGDWAFCNCAMTEIALPSTLEELGDYAFYESKLETVTIPDGITAIGEGVFGNSDELQTVYLPQSIEQLGYHAFCYCCRLDRVYYDGLRTDWEQVEIDDECFEHAPVVHFTDGTHLCAPGSPVSVTVQQSTCGGPGSYEEVYYCRECGEEMYREQKEIQAERHLWGDWTVLAPPTATEEGLMERHCIRDESHTETALIPAGEFSEHELLKGYCGGEGDGKNLIWTLTDDNVITISGEGAMADYGDYYIAVNHINNYCAEGFRRGPDVPWPGEGNDPIQRWFALQGYYNDSDIMDLIVNGGIDWDALTDAIFSEDQPAYTVVVEPGVTYVGANAFAGTNVTALSLPSTAEEIGYGAFYGLNCKDLVLPEGVRWVGANAFSSGNYENLTLPASLEGLGGGAFQLDPGYDGHTCTLTVLCPDERVSGILSGITVRGMRTEMAGIGSIEDYRDAVLVRYLAEAYYVIQHFDALVEEEISYFEEDLGTALTPQQRENVGEYYLWAYTYELRNFGVNLELGEQSAATVCNEINRILGTSFAPEELFEIHETGNGTFDVDIRLSPAASARFTERFGIAYDEVNTGWYYSSLNWLKENEETVIAPYLTLRGHCGSGLESEYADTVPFEAVEHDPANGEVILEPTCTTPGQRSVTCPVCGETFTEEIPAPGGHCYQISVTTAPTCTENGEVTYTCLICGDTYTETLVALGHGTLDYDVSGAPSTCIVRGYSMTICIACGEITDYQEFPLDPTNHNWGEWTVVTPATYLTEGLEQRTCGWCGETETNVIPALVPDEVISDPDTGIELQLQEGVLPENTVFTVDEEFDGTYFRLLNREVGNLSSTLYNITPVADGVNVQPDGWVLVRLPIPAGYNPDSLSIYYISTETGVTERMDCYVEDGYICFQTTHFSVYAIVDASAPAEAPTETPTNNGGGTSLSFFARIAAFFRSIAEFFRNLFRR